MRTKRDATIWGTAAAIVLVAGLAASGRADHNKGGTPRDRDLPIRNSAPTTGTHPVVDLHEAAIYLREEATQLCWDIRRTAAGTADFNRLYREAYEIYTIATAIERVHNRPAILPPKLKHMNRELHEFRELSERARTRSRLPVSLGANGVSIWMAGWQQQLGWRVIDQRVAGMHELTHAMLGTLDARPTIPRRVTAAPPPPSQVNRVQPLHAHGHSAPHSHATEAHRPVTSHHDVGRGPAIPGLTVRPQGRRIVIGDGRSILFSFSLD